MEEVGLQDDREHQCLECDGKRLSLRLIHGEDGLGHISVSEYGLKHASRPQVGFYSGFVLMMMWMSRSKLQ